MPKLKHPHRKAIAGLTPASVLQEMTLAAKSPPVVREEAEINPPALPPVVSSIEHSPAGTSGKALLSEILKRLLSEPADGQAEGQAVQTRAEAIGAIVMAAALKEKQWAIEFIRDQVEGRPQKGQQIDRTEMKTEEQLDDLTLSRLKALEGK